MANAAALIRESIWRDGDFRKLPRMAQCMYLQVLSQKDLDCAGVLTLHLELLAKGCAELTVEDIRGDLKVLETARFVFVDEDTDELLIRSYAREVSAKSPNAWKSAFKAARMIQSPKLRTELATELRRIRRADATELANELNPIQTPSQSHTNPIQTPSGRDIPSEPHSDPPRLVPVVGHLSLVSTQVGERPSEFCSQHPSGTDDKCRPCGRARESYQQRMNEWRGLIAAVREKAIADCPLCDDFGDIAVSDNSIRKCDHQATVNA
jgi:hypothetical protein